MQLFSRNKALAALSLGALAALGACGDDVTVPAPVNPPVVVTVSPSNANVNVGSFVDLAVSITGGATTPTLTACATSNAAVATAAVQGGNACRVTGVSTGAVSITATTSAGQTAGASVTVNAPAPAISGIAISPAASNLQVNGTVTITANPTTQAPGASVARAFVSSNAQVATVTSAGVVTAVAPGQATITVTLTGTGTGLTAATVTGQVAITVTANPPSVTGVTASPASATLVTGGTQQLTATATYATGNTGTITYGTSNPGVASVSGTGLVTAVGPGQAVITVTASSAGNASFAAASATAQVPVTVNAPAQVSIANITQGGSNNPVTINNVSGQIQVQLNLLTNNNVVRSVRLFICPVGGSCPMAPAAEQTFGTSGAASGDINMFINTADFTVAADWSDAAVRYTNGQVNLVAQIATETASQANNNLAILTLNNADAFAARHQTGTLASAINTTTNLTWFGGPTGRGNVTVVPVIYTAGRTVARANVNITGTACSNTAYTFVTGTDARPWTLEYGRYTTAPAATTRQRQCTSTSTGLDLGVAVSGVIDNAQNSITVATFATNTSGQNITAPAVIRGDFQGPSFTVSAPATQWASITNSYSFRTNTSAPTDAGVGPAAVSTFTYVANGCGLTNAAFDGTTGSGVMPECATDFTQNPYTVTGTGADLLGNTATATTGVFGIDNTAPAIRYTVGSAWGSGTPFTPGQNIAPALSGTFGDTATFTTVGSSLFTFASILPVPAVAAPSDTIWGVDALDERAGLNTWAHYLATANQANATGTCAVAGATPVIGSSFITAPGCSYTTPANVTGAAMVDGYRPIVRITTPTIATEGYYSYQARVTDRAGNTSTLPVRRVLHLATSPVITGLGVPGTITAAGPNAFTPNFTEAVEAHFSNLRLSYGSLTAADGTTDANFVFPATLFNGRFDNSIGLNGNLTISTPFTSGVNLYTNIEQTAVNGAITAPTVSRPDSVSARVVNAAGQSSGFYNTGGANTGVALLNGNIANDAAAWATFNANIQSFALGTDASAWNAPANGLKAVVTATTNQINSPFTRVDFYEQVTGAWVYLGSVDGTAAPSVSPAGTGPVYIADNGATRVWTYRLTTVVNGANALTGGNTAITGALTGARRFIAIATNGTKGRALSTNVTASQVQP